MYSNFKLLYILNCFVYYIIYVHCTVADSILSNAINSMAQFGNYVSNQADQNFTALETEPSSAANIMSRKLVVVVVSIKF